MNPYLLLDFGTTSTKSALVDLDTGIFARLQRHPAIPGIPAPPGRCEIPLEAIRSRFLRICSDYYDLMPFQGILLCSEMHGFALLDWDGNPLTPYISWKDERSLETLEGKDTFSLVAGQLGPAFKRITGMHPRPGFPLMNLAHLGRATPLPEGARILSLPCWLARCSGQASELLHPTILAGMGLYDVRRHAVSAELLELLRELTGCCFALGEPAPAHRVAGHWQGVPIYVGVGDHQCAVLGAGNAPRQTLSINLGTGSQVTIIDWDSGQDEIETRPYFGPSQARTITHIPAGRALATHLHFLRETAGPHGPDFWALLAGLGEEEVARSTLRFDLSLFKSARHYREGGSITRIEEGSLTLRNYLSSLLKSWMGQYLEIARLFDPDHRLSRCILSGGLARELPLLHSLLARRSGYSTLPATELDETLLGLRTLALVAAGRARDYLEAQAIFGRECRVEERFSAP